MWGVSWLSSDAGMPTEKSLTRLLRQEALFMTKSSVSVISGLQGDYSESLFRALGVNGEDLIGEYPDNHSTESIDC